MQTTQLQSQQQRHQQHKSRLHSPVLVSLLLTSFAVVLLLIFFPLNSIQFKRFLTDWSVDFNNSEFSNDDNNTELLQDNENVELSFADFSSPPSHISDFSASPLLQHQLQRLHQIEWRLGILTLTNELFT